MSTRISLVFAAALVAGGCQDPLDFGAPRSCDSADQNIWVDHVMGQVYLWNDELPELDPATFESPAALVSALRFSPPDKWSRVADREKSDALFDSGEYVGLGFRTRRDAEDAVRIASVYPGSPADKAGFVRGDTLRAVNTFSVEKIDADNLWGQVYGENLPGITVSLEVESADGSVRQAFLTKTWVEIDTVPIAEILPVDGVKVGYVLFESFVEPAHGALDEAFSTFAAQDVRHLVVDLRYNGGGLLSVATHLASLIGGGVKSGEVFYRARYNAALSDENWTRKLSDKAGSLNLERVVFITSGSTLSASELVINGLLPHVDVTIVGGVTGGKPVGTRAFDFCDKVLFPITFRLVNADDVSDYFDGLSPDCAAIDDLSVALGDPEEASLAAAIAAVTAQTCTRAATPVRAGLPVGPIRVDGLGDILGGAW